MSRFFVGRHPHADERGLQPASADALFGGKGLPPCETPVSDLNPGFLIDIKP